MKRKLRKIKYLLIFGFVAGLIGGGYSVQNTSSQRDATCASYRTGHAVLLGTLKPVQAKETPEKTEAEKIEELGLLVWGAEWSQFKLVIACESSWKTEAVSYTGCCHGLGQVNAPVHGIRADWLKDWRVNIVVSRKIYERAGNSFSPWNSSKHCWGPKVVL